MAYPTLEQQFDAWDFPTRGSALHKRLEALRPYIESSRYALTAADVVWDFETGRNRYAADIPTPERTP